ncbi:MAG: hypothetical protein ACTHNH_00480 [Mesorhizobium sp.]
MKTASSLLQTIALGALLAAQVHGAITMPGVRQALRIIGTQSSPVFCNSGNQAATVRHSGIDWAPLEPCP